MPASRARRPHSRIASEPMHATSLGPSESRDRAIRSCGPARLDSHSPEGGLVINLLFRVAYRGAYQLMRIYWRAVHPQAHGALVAIWHDGRILLVRNSYVR